MIACDVSLVAMFLEIQCELYSTQVVFAGDAAVGKTSFINRNSQETILYTCHILVIFDVLHMTCLTCDIFLSLKSSKSLVIMIIFFRITKIIIIFSRIIKIVIIFFRITKGVFMSNLSSTLGVDFQVTFIIFITYWSL